ncbi:E3 ubiquitin-protein ligase RNF181 [Hemicordylus capensis]|uniref:E3 ubiquitin-protein ligase RNF181 n=1 Tax=Hemicordylus capensis TaxID=884348 RepID=UPI002303136A|nr:E3 ubiquitin-protein ligase RNF181 [Hemicordylus capensis]
MASYFEEHDCEPGSGPPSEERLGRALLELARSLFNGLEIDLGSLDSGGWEQRLPPPAARRAVESLPAVPVTPQQADKGLKCPVCLLEFEEAEVVRKMPCQHLFHTGCILPWLGKTNSCPLCRHELPTDDETYEEYKKEKDRRQQQAHRLEYLHGAMYT